MGDDNTLIVECVDCRALAELAHISLYSEAALVYAMKMGTRERLVNSLNARTGQLQWLNIARFRKKKTRKMQ